MSDNEQEEEKRAFRSKLYTKTGDKGTSALYNGERRPKNDTFFHSLGSVDELSACMGVALEYCIIDKNGLEEYLEKLISICLDIGACIATPLDNSKETQKEKTKFNDNHVKVLESWIDKIDSKLPPLKYFVIPIRVGLASSHLHLARTVCRRAEREIIGLSKFGLIPDTVAIFMNRLSDFLFASARHAAFAHDDKYEEKNWYSKTDDFN